MVVKSFRVPYHPFKKMQWSRGFTLLEVLIALIIMAIGSLGLGQLQLISLKNNQSSYFRSQANLLASDMIDRMRINSSVAHLYLGTVVGTDSGTEAQCTQCKDPSTPCLPSQLVALDLCGWQVQLAKLRTGATAVVSKHNGVYSISISWDDPAVNAGVVTVVSNPSVQLTLSFLL